MTEPTANVPDARLLIATGCAHCGGVLQVLGALVKEGLVGRLEVVNLAVRPEAAEGVRSVPWIRIGGFELSGAQTEETLRQWAERAAKASGDGNYLGHLLEERELERVVELVQSDLAQWEALGDLLAAEETTLTVRLGIGAVVEELAGSEAGRAFQPRLQRLLHAAEPRVRADACHFLGLVGDAGARDLIKPLLEDEDAEVREVAEEALELLAGQDKG